MSDPKKPPTGSQIPPHSTIAFVKQGVKLGVYTEKQLKAYAHKLQADNAKATLKRTEKQLSDAASALSTQQHALTTLLAGTPKLLAVHYSQTGTTATITYNYAPNTPTSLLPAVGSYVYIHDLKNVSSTAFNGTFTTPITENIPFTRHMVKVLESSTFLIKVQVNTSTTTFSTDTAGPIYFNPNYSIPNPSDTGHMFEYRFWDSVETNWTKKDYLQSKYSTLLDKQKKDKNNVTKTVTPGSGGSKGTKDTGGAKTLTGDTTLNYNMPSVRWAYFRDSTSFVLPGTSSSVGYESVLLNQGGSPATQGQINDALELWTNPNSGAQKGMIQTFTGWKKRLSGSAATSATKSTNKDPNIPDWYISSSYQTRRYGFQFLYNPSNVTQGWGGTPTVDPGLLMSGKDVTPFITPTQTASYISFDLVINRMPDMALLNGIGPDAVAADLDRYYAINKSATDYATTDTTYLQELEAIQELGTMYDIEYLLSTLIGFREYSALRGRYTADFGFLMGLPVELHLGKQLRYVGTIMDMQVTHTIFTAGMIPVFTNLSIGFARRVEPFNGTAQISASGSLLSKIAPVDTGGGFTKPTAQ